MSYLLFKVFSVCRIQAKLIGLPFVWVMLFGALCLPVRANEASDTTEQLFQSRFGSDDSFDLTRLSLCQPEPKLSAPSLFVEPATSASSKRRFSYQSAPEISPQRTHVKGEVVVQDEKSIIKADEVIWERKQQQLVATGGVSIESKNAFFAADSLNKNERENTVLMDNTEFYLFANNANGKAQEMTLENNTLATLKELTFSTCAVTQQSWQLATSEMLLDVESGRGEAWNATLKVKGVPVFYFPYLNFPIDKRRQSGLLSPRLKNSDKSGLDFALPIYWNIAPNMDATIAPRHMSKRGSQLEGEFRWLTQRTYTELYTEWMGKDRLVAQALANPTSGVVTNANSSQRWMGKFNHTAVFSDSWLFQFDTQRVSDKDYFRDFSSGLQGANETQLSSRVNLSYQDYIWDINFFAVTHQSLINNESYRYLPSLNARADYLSEAGFRWQLDSEWSRFKHNDINRLEGTRTNIMPSLSYPIRANWGELTPKLSYQATYYQQQSQISGDETNVSRTLPIFSLDSRLYFDRKAELFSESYTHTLSPRVFYSYIPNKKQTDINLFDTTLPILGFNQLWRENRFSGIDRVGDTNHVSVALANTLVKNNSGKELFRFNLGRKFYFEDRQVQLDNSFTDIKNASPWLAEVSFKLDDSLSFDGFIEWDDDREDTNQASARIKFEPKANHIVNLSHRYRDIAGQVNEETDFSFAWSINDGWRFLGRWYNDLRRDQMVEALAGIEYESCCWAIRLVAQRYLNTQLDAQGIPIVIGNERYNNGIYFQFVFKGLGSAGRSGMSELLESSVHGYRDPLLAKGQVN